jgi:hypothetical protein
MRIQRVSKIRLKHNEQFFNDREMDASDGS